MNFAIVVVPIEVDSDVPVSSPISAKRVVGFKHSLEMQSMFMPNTLDTEVVHNKGELYWAPVVLP